ncbi:MAG: hypothetical protein IKI42_01055, partial [Clostridia bacterium]|nr:hypothetical protein [Clostridia bacterium]
CTRSEDFVYYTRYSGEMHSFFVPLIAIRLRAAGYRSMWSAAPSGPIRGRDYTLDVVGRSFWPDPRPDPACRSAFSLVLPHSRSFLPGVFRFS